MGVDEEQLINYEQLKENMYGIRIGVTTILGINRCFEENE